MANAAYWNSPAVDTVVFEVAKMLLYVSVGIYVMDFINTLSFDLSILTGKRQRRWPQLAYFGTKYIWITYMLMNMILLWTVGEIKCQIFFELLEMQMGFVVCLSSFLLACRTICVYQGTARRVISLVLLVFGLGLTATWMYGVKDVTAVWTTEAATAWNHGACNPVELKSTYWVKYVITIIFDLLVLILTAVGILRMEAHSRIGDILIRQGLIFFILTFAANLIITVLTALQLSPHMSLLFAVPQSTVCVICSTRLYNMLANEAGRQVRSSSLGSSSYANGLHSESKIDNFFSSPHLNRTAFPSHGSGRSASGSIGSQSGSAELPPPSPAITNVRIEQTRQIEVDATPPYLSGTHPFGARPMDSVQEEGEAQDPSSAEVASMFPRLSSRKAVP